MAKVIEKTEVDTEATPLKRVKQIKDFVIRNIQWIILLIIGLFTPKIASWLSGELKTVCYVIGFEAVALFLCGCAKIVYTNVDFTTTNKDNPDYNKIYMTKLIVLGLIFIGVHILVGLSVFSIYISQTVGN